MSLHIEGWRWFQRTYGNTYHSVRIWKDGQLIAHLPYQYGYGDQWLQTALDWLRAEGHIPDRCSTCDGTKEEHPKKYYRIPQRHETRTCDHFQPYFGTHYLRETLGGTYSVIDVERKKEL
jgi:hypothetical protein